MRQRTLVLEVQGKKCELCEKQMSSGMCSYTSAEYPRRPHRGRSYCLSELRVSETEARGRFLSCQGRSYFSGVNHVFM